MNDIANHQAVKINNLEDENDRLKAEIERLQDLQSPEHERLWEVSKAAMQGMASRGWHGDDLDILAKRSVSAARALIAEVDGSPAAPATVLSKGAKNEPGLGPVPQREAPEGVHLWKPDAITPHEAAKVFLPHSPAREHAQELLEALGHAERKLSSYVGVCNGDKELTQDILPRVRALLAKVKEADHERG